jgi:hypothetical protein
MHLGSTIMQIDIEGAECRVFAPEADRSWLQASKVVVLELHDRMAGYYNLPHVSNIVHEAMDGLQFNHYFDGEHDFYVHKEVDVNTTESGGEGNSPLQRL